MSPWLITTTAFSWAIGAALRGAAGAQRRPSEAAIVLAAVGLGCLVVFQLRARRDRSAS